MKGYRKIRIQLYTSPTSGFTLNDLIPYKNRWGKYVWRQPDIDEDKNWPGIKPPKNCIGVECIENIWYWKYKES
jgi:hypothetical protein